MSRKQSSPNFKKNELFLPSDRQTYVCVSAQPVRDVPGTSPEDFPKVLTSGTSRGPPWDLQGTLRGPTQKLMISWKSVFVLVLHISYCFLLEKQILKSSKWGRPRKVYRIQLRDVPGAKWWDVLATSGTSVIHVIFKFNSEIYKLTLTGYSRLYSEL